MTPAISTKTRTTDSTDRLAVLPSAKTAPAAQPKTPARFGAARRLLTSLMRSLASPHI